MKQRFYKTVRSDGSSVWAVGKYRTIYEVGKSYKFDPKWPAHVFGLVKRASYDLSEWDNSEWHCSYPNFPTDIFPLQTCENKDLIYRYRAEPVGNRVLVGEGIVKTLYVPYYPTGRHWLKKNLVYYLRFTCDDFKIVGEIFPSVVDEETEFDYRSVRVEE